MYIAKREEIQRRRQECELTMAQLSKKAGLPNNAICRIEIDKCKRTHPIRAKAIAEALCCEVTDIFTDEKELSHE